MAKPQSRPCTYGAWRSASLCRVAGSLSSAVLVVALIGYSLALAADTELVLSSSSGIVEGRITNEETGEGIPEALVRLSGTPLGDVADTEGYFEILGVEPGEYELVARMIGYRTLTLTGVVVRSDLRTRLDLQLEPTSIEMEAVEVRATAPLIQKDLATTTFSLSEVKIEKMPVSGVGEVLSLQPGTTVEGNVRGGKTSDVLYVIDGVPAKDYFEGDVLSRLPLTSISSVSITSGGFEAQYGGALSGVVNIVTKTPTAEGIFIARVERDKILPEDWSKQTDRMTEGSVVGGGTIIPSVLTYFTAHTLTLSDTRWWQDFDRSIASPVSKNVSGITKFEIVPTSDLRITLHGLYDIRRWRDYEFSWRFNLEGLPERRKETARGTVGLTYTASSNLLLSLTTGASYAHHQIGRSPLALDTFGAYEYDIYLRYVLNGQRLWYARKYQTDYLVKGEATYYYQHSHLIKAGFELHQYDLDSYLQKFEPQLTYFGKPIQSSPLLNFSNNYAYAPFSGGIYIQDRFELTRDGSNFSFGVRWDFLDPRASRPVVEFVPVAADEYQQVIVGSKRATVKTQFSPRASYSGQIGEDGHFFFNYGLYVQFPLFDYLYAGIDPAFIRSGARAVLSGNPDLEPERSVAWELGYKQGLDDKTLISVTYFSRSFTNQIDSKTLVPTDSKFAGDYGYATYVNTAEGKSEGVELVVSRTQGDGVEGSISYTYMSAEGLSEYVDQRVNFEQWGFPLSPQPFSLSWDQRHSVKADISFPVLLGINCSVNLFYHSPRPYTYFPSRDGIHPDDTTRFLLPNNDRMFDVWTINTRFRRDFTFGERDNYSVSIYVDAKNLLNARNVRWMDSSGRVGGELGDPAAYYDPRRVRLGLQIDW